MAARRRKQRQLMLKLGVIADPHLSVLRDEPMSAQERPSGKRRSAPMKMRGVSSKKD